MVGIEEIGDRRTEGGALDQLETAQSATRALIRLVSHTACSQPQNSPDIALCSHASLHVSPGSDT
jgi:hypothetical protein